MESICEKCTADPTSHSFKKVAEKPGVQVFYTNPAKARLYKDTDGIVKHYVNTLEQLGENKWSWIFDSEGFDMRHALEVKTGIAIAKLISNRFGNKLEEIKIINPTWHIKIMLNTLWPFLTQETKNKVKIFKDRYYSVLEFL